MTSFQTTLAAALFVASAASAVAAPPQSEQPVRSFCGPGKEYIATRRLTEREGVARFKVYTLTRHCRTSFLYEARCHYRLKIVNGIYRGKDVSNCKEIDARTDIAKRR